MLSIIEFVLIATLTYGVFMGGTLHAFSERLGVSRGDIVASALIACVCGLTGWWTFLIIAALEAWYYGLHFSWQMHRSYPTDPKYVDRYIQLYGRIRGH